MRRLSFAALAILTIAFSLQTADAGQISIMTYNVENLFDPEDDPQLNDQEFTPDGRAAWDWEKVDRKLANLTKVVTSVKNPNGMSCPDVLGLTEVENRNILTYWRDNYLKSCKYDHIIIHRQDPHAPVQNDRRGIKVALMSRVPTAGSSSTYLVYEGTRYILEVPLKIGDSRFVVFVNHWKSRAGGGEEKRKLSALTLRQRLEYINEQDPYLDMIVLGDMNDEPENESLQSTLRVSPYARLAFEDLHEAFLWNTSYNDFYLPDIMEEARRRNETGQQIDLEKLERDLKRMRGTYYYHREKTHNQLDHILISRGLFDNESLRYVHDSYKVIRHPDFTRVETIELPNFTEDTIWAPIPYRPHYDGDVGGASDHFPVVARFTYE